MKSTLGGMTMDQFDELAAEVRRGFYEFFEPLSGVIEIFIRTGESDVLRSALLAVAGAAFDDIVTQVLK